MFAHHPATCAGFGRGPCLCPPARMQSTPAILGSDEEILAGGTMELARLPRPPAARWEGPGHAMLLCAPASAVDNAVRDM